MLTSFLIIEKLENGKTMQQSFQRKLQAIFSFEQQILEDGILS